MTEYHVPEWACSQWGNYEHDWLDCHEYLRAYEKWIEKGPPMPNYYNLVVDQLAIGDGISTDTTGVDMGLFIREPDEEKVRTLLERYPDTDNEGIFKAEFHDNGEFGDGVTFKVTCGCTFPEGLAGTYVEFGIPDQAIPVWIAALQSLLAFREAQGHPIEPGKKPQARIRRGGP